MGGMGGAQPLAATMNEGAVLVVEVDPERIERRIETRYCDRMTHDLDEALAWVLDAAAAARPLSVGLVGNCAEVLPELVRRGVTPDVVTDQTSAHDALNGYVPAGCRWTRRRRCARSDPAEYVRRSMESMRGHCEAMVEMMRARRRHLRLRQQPARPGARRRLRRRLRLPGVRAGVRAPALLRGEGALPLGGALRRPGGHPSHRRAGAGALPRDEHLRRWITQAREKVAFQGLPARICWLGQGERARFGVALNDLVASGELKAPIVIGATTWTPARWRRRSARRRR
jgi:urocanate hydratase